MIQRTWEPYPACLSDQSYFLFTDRFSNWKLYVLVQDTTTKEQIQWHKQQTFISHGSWGGEVQDQGGDRFCVGKNPFLVCGLPSCRVSSCGLSLVSTYEGGMKNESRKPWDMAEQHLQRPHPPFAPISFKAKANVPPEATGLSGLPPPSPQPLPSSHTGPLDHRASREAH